MSNEVNAGERAALVALKDARVRIPKVGGAGAIYERELLSVVDAAIDLLEADGKLIALAEKTISEASQAHSRRCEFSDSMSPHARWEMVCTCNKAKYDAAKEAQL
jgi:spermidine synthase